MGVGVCVCVCVGVCVCGCGCGCVCVCVHNSVVYSICGGILQQSLALKPGTYSFLPIIV